MIGGEMASKDRLMMSYAIPQQALRLRSVMQDSPRVGEVREPTVKKRLPEPRLVLTTATAPDQACPETEWDCCHDICSN
jgi:hypothetical protein